MELSLKFKYRHMGSMKFCLECNIYHQHCANVLLVFLRTNWIMYLYSSFQSLEKVDFKWGDSQISIPIPQATQEQYSYYFVYCFLVFPFTTQYPSTYLFHWKPVSIFLMLIQTEDPLSSGFFSYRCTIHFILICYRKMVMGLQEVRIQGWIQVQLDSEIK